MTVSYAGFTDTFTVEVTEVVPTSLSIETPPTKRHYVETEAVALDGLTLRLQYNDGSSRLLDSCICDKETVTLGDTALTFSYGNLTAGIPITVERKLLSLTISRPLDQQTYVVGEKLNLTDAEITAHYLDGTSEVVAATPSIPDGTQLEETDTALVYTLATPRQSASVSIPLTVEYVEHDGFLLSYTYEAPAARSQIAELLRFKISKYVGEAAKIVIPEECDGIPITEIGSLAFLNSNLLVIKIGNNITRVHSDSFEGCENTVLCPEFSSRPEGWEDGCLDDLPVVWAFHSIVIDDYYDYGITGGKVYITAYRGLSPIVVIPETIEGLPVVSLCATFSENTALTHIVLPDSLEEIGDHAFDGCSRLTTVTIPDSVTSIGSYAFADCSSLTSITIPDSVTSIGSSFVGCRSLTSITIPDSVTSIGSYAFYGCSSLTSITIPESVTSIGGYAFYGCSSLTNITIPDSVTSIGSYAFNGCSSLTNISVDENNPAFCSIDGNLYSKDGKTLIRYAPGKTAPSFAIADSVTSIESYAFSGCSSLTSITIPDSVTSIGSYAFAYCSSLTSIVIPDSVTSIGDRAFYDCDNLTSIIIPDSVTSIGSSAFADCRSLASITIPDSVTSIGSYAFSGCSKLYLFFEGISSDVALAEDWNPDGRPVYSGAVMYESSAEFYLEVSGLTATVVKYIGKGGDVLIPDAVTLGGRTYLITGIADGAFADAEGVRTVTVGANIHRIGSSAFDGCRELTAVYVATNSDSYKVEDGLLYTKDGRELITALPYAAGDLVLPTGLEIIHAYAFEGCPLVTSVTLPASVHTVASFAFYGASGLEALLVNEESPSYCAIDGVLFSKDLSVIYCYPAAKAGAFYTIPANVTYVESYCFENPSLTYLLLLNDSATLRDHSFRSGQRIISATRKFLYIGTSVPVPDVIALAEQDGLLFALQTGEKAVVVGYIGNPTNVTLPEAVTVDEVEYTVTAIGGYAFRNCRSLTSVSIPDSVTRIGNYAFRDCSSLTSVSISDSVAEIGTGAFDGCPLPTPILPTP